MATNPKAIIPDLKSGVTSGGKPQPKTYLEMIADDAREDLNVKKKPMSQTMIMNDPIYKRKQSLVGVIPILKGKVFCCCFGGGVKVETNQPIETH